MCVRVVHRDEDVFVYVAGTFPSLQYVSHDVFGQEYIAQYLSINWTEILLCCTFKLLVFFIILIEAELLMQIQEVEFLI